jgi:hypothetical protein
MPRNGICGSRRIIVVQELVDIPDQLVRLICVDILSIGKEHPVDVILFARLGVVQCTGEAGVCLPWYTWRLRTNNGCNAHR